VALADAVLLWRCPRLYHCSRACGERRVCLLRGDDDATPYACAYFDRRVSELAHFISDPSRHPPMGSGPPGVEGATCQAEGRRQRLCSGTLGSPPYFGAGFILGCSRSASMISGCGLGLAPSGDPPISS
jgi:hypothetical protein